MGDLLLKLDGWLTRRRKLVIGLWVAALVVAAPLSAIQSTALTEGGFQVEGSDSHTANQALQDDFGERQPNALGVVLVREGASPQEFSKSVDEYAKIAAGVDNIEVPPAAVESARTRALTSDKVLFALTVIGNQDESADAAVKLRDDLKVKEGARDGVRPYMIGAMAFWAALHELQKTDVQKAERVGVPITALILLATFGTLAAAALPLLLGIASVVITGALIFLVAQALPMSVYVTSSASMIGIGVAIDYSLFVLARYRQEIASGRTEDDARREALRTSGIAVVFSGLTVIVSLCALLAFPTVALRSMALGAIIVVSMAMLAAVTLMPAVMTILGPRVYEPGRTAVWRDRIVGRFRREGGDFWGTWTRRVMARPMVTAILAALALLALAIPALDVEIREESRSQLPAGHDAIQGLNQAAPLIGPGALGPFVAVVRFNSGTAKTPANQQALSAYSSAVESDREVAYVTPPRPSEDGRQAALTIVPRHFGEHPDAQALLGRLRADRGGRALAPVGSVSFGGDVAMVHDFADNVADGVFRAFLILVCVTFVIMMILLRSMLLPVKAVVMNILTVAATTGIIVGIFQWGWLSWTGYEEPGYIAAEVIPLMMAVVFGLSMDYEVFMLTRIREAFMRSGDNREAVANGLRSSASTITSAALIMVSVFFAFAAVRIPSIRQIGTALGVAVALDATLVRLVLVPATMGLLGRWNWWLPTWLHRMPRVLPEVVPESGVSKGS
ncbi:MAG TPA: MMPL family transporter [Thermoleophilaceae bacterium]